MVVAERADLRGVKSQGGSLHPVSAADLETKSAPARIQEGGQDGGKMRTKFRSKNSLMRHVTRVSATKFRGRHDKIPSPFAPFSGKRGDKSDGFVKARVLMRAL